MNDPYWPTPEEREYDERLRDPDYIYQQRRRFDRLYSKPVNLDRPEDQFPILAVDPDDIGPPPEPYTGPVELPF